MPDHTIERADTITGWSREWDIGDVPQRTHYANWLRRQPPADVKPHLPADVGLFWLETQPMDAIASLICAIDEARKPKGDGLPPGPWRHRGTTVTDADGRYVRTTSPGFSEARNHDIAAYIARCGSEPVQRILAACDDDELARWATFIGKWRLPAFDIENVESLARATVTFKPR